MPDARVEEVIITSLECRGNGSDGDPNRRVLQVYAKDGTLLAENDPWSGERELLAKAALDDAIRKQQLAEDALRIGATNHLKAFSELKDKADKESTEHFKECQKLHDELYAANRALAHFKANPGRAAIKLTDLIESDVPRTGKSKSKPTLVDYIRWIRDLKFEAGKIK